MIEPEQYAVALEIQDRLNEEEIDWKPLPSSEKWIQLHICNGLQCMAIFIELCRIIVYLVDDFHEVEYIYPLGDPRCFDNVTDKVLELTGKKYGMQRHCV